MISRTHKFAAAFFATVLLAAGALVPSAGAQVNQDGLVNVTVGDITVEDINVGVAAGIAATACDLVGPLAVAVLGQAVAVDASGRSRTICTTESGPVTITQN